MKALTSILLLLIVLFSACKKDDPEPKPEPDDFSYTDAQVVLPTGSTLDLTKTSVLSLSKISSVKANGKTSIRYNTGTWEVVYLLDANKNILMASIISDENKEISIKTTAQAMLYYGLQLHYTVSTEERIEAIKKIPSYTQFPGFMAELEKLFLEDPTMIAQGKYLATHIKTVNEITYVPVIDIRGKQIVVEDPDPTKSGLTVRPRSGSDESVEIANEYQRRAHAFFYKMSYKDMTNTTWNPIPEILPNTPPTNQLPVLGASVSGPQALPLESHERSSIWKVRIVGPGGDESISTETTTAEQDKLDDLWLEFFAADLLLPIVLDNLNQTSSLDLIMPNDINRIQPYIDEVKALVKPSTMKLVKNGEYIESLKDFRETVLWDSYKLEGLYNKLLQALRAITSNNAVQAEGDLEDIAEYNQNVLDFTDKVMNGTEKEEISYGIDEIYKKIHLNCNYIDEWTVISKDNDVTITPKHSKVGVLTNHTLTASTKAELAAGETIEYTWTTSGAYGVFKNGAQELTTVTTSATTINYYGKVAPETDNMETVYVTAFIKSASGTRELGKDTAYINVKKLIVKMLPDDAVLSPKRGVASVKLYLLNADGTDPIVQSDFVHYKVEWSTAGSYGHLTGNTTQLTTSGNSVHYTATDEDVKSGIETITAHIYFRFGSEPSWTLREIVKGKVEVSNDTKTIVYYTSPQSYHSDRNDWHYTGCGVFVPKMENAISYSVQVTGIASNLYPTYSDSWTVTGNEDHVRGYMGYVFPKGDEVGDDYLTGIYGTFSWGSCGSCSHRVATATGTAKVTVVVSQ
ncbi:MAG: hypothetical protein SF052_00150 [Bacteroidia bacterium]|nr:hypothetical protein [Bacteroidia bacterium]